MLTEQQVKEMTADEVFVFGEATFSKIRGDRYRVDNGGQMFVGSDLKQALELFNGEKGGEGV